MIKLSKTQLRKLINESIKTRQPGSPLFEIENTVNPDAETAKRLEEYFVSALTSLQAGENFQHALSSYFESAIDDDVFIPWRIEDITPMADSVAKIIARSVAQNPEFQKWLSTAIARTFRRLL